MYFTFLALVSFWESEQSYGSFTKKNDHLSTSLTSQIPWRSIMSHKGLRVKSFVSRVALLGGAVDL
jgi:hypothetical protein